MTIVAVLGTGLMGAGMARSALREGHDVRVWNRSRAKAAPLADDGAVIADSPAHAVTGADVVVTMLYDVDSVLDVAEQAKAAFGPAAVWLQMSTIGTDGTKAVAQFADRNGLNVLDAPVLGTKAPAEQGALVVLASGDPALRAAAQPVFDAMGSRTLWAGDEVGRASALKLACNAWVASITAATAQSVALAQAQGLDPELFLQAIDGGATDTPYAHVKGAAMIKREFPVSFALEGVRKDLGLIGAAARTAGVSTVLLDALAEAFSTASAAGHGSEDMGAVIDAFLPSS